jgi:hypothetical protein
MKQSHLLVTTTSTLALAGYFLLSSATYAAPAPTAVPTSVTTQMYNNAHTGWNANETQLTVANVKTNFKLLFTDKTAGQTYSQPLYVPGVKIGSRIHNVIFAATENNIVYAFDADKAGKPLWMANLTPSGETLQTMDDYDNTRIPQIGITGTPVIDPSIGTLFAVAASKTTSTPSVFHQRLHALDITTGKERANSPVDVSAKYPGVGGENDGNGNVVFDPLAEFNRTALTLFQGNIYTAWSAHEDIGVPSGPSAGEYQGWVIAYNETTLQQAAVFNDSPNLVPGAAPSPGGSSIWQASVGMVADNASLYAVTANGPFDSNADYGDTALRLTPSLTLADSFTPCNQQELDDLDVDLGSGGPMLLPTQTSAPQNLMTFAGKEGSIYLVDRTSMGGYTPTTVADNVPCNDNIVQKLWRVLGVTDTNGSSDRDAYWGAPAYFSDSTGRQYVYYSGDYAPIMEWDLANGSLTAGLSPGGQPNQTPSSEYNFPHGGSIPVISSNGGDTSTAILWVVRHVLPPSPDAGPLTLDAYAANDLTNQIVFDAPAGGWNYNNNAWLIPTVANGKVYVFSGSGLAVFGVSSVVPGGTGSIRIARSLNFGKVAANSTKTRTFTVRNAGKGDLHVSSISAQAPFQLTGTGTLNLAKGQSAAVSVEFMPTTTGAVSEALTINCDDPNNPTPSLTLTGTGK